MFKNHVHMRVLLLAILAILIVGCTNNYRFELRICSDIDASKPCVDEDSIYLVGSNLWAQLILDPDFEEDLIIGNIYRFEEGERILMSNKELEIRPNQRIVLEMMTFNLDGNYEVEFTDKNGRYLIKRSFEIW